MCVWMPILMKRSMYASIIFTHRSYCQWHISGLLQVPMQAGIELLLLREIRRPWHRTQCLEKCRPVSPNLSSWLPNATQPHRFCTAQLYFDDYVIWSERPNGMQMKLLCYRNSVHLISISCFFHFQSKLLWGRGSGGRCSLLSMPIRPKGPT